MKVSRLQFMELRPTLPMTTPEERQALEDMRVQQRWLMFVNSRARREEMAAHRKVWRDKQLPAFLRKQA